LTAPFKKISIIVPTRNRATSLKALLDSLARAEPLKGAVTEIVVVNNGSTDATAALLQKLSTEFKPYSLRVLDQPAAGKSYALNMALADSSGDLLIVFDDDVTADPHCLTSLVNTYGDGNFAAVQGRILPGVDPAGQSAELDRLEEYNIPLIDYGAEVREISGLTGTNMSFTRELVNRVGYFDTRLGPGAAGFSEDSEFSIRIRKAGFKIGYTPHAIVYHELNPNRYGRNYNRQVEYRKGISRSIYRKESIAFNVVPNLLANCFRLVLYRSLGLHRKSYKTEGRVYKCLGYMAGKFRRAGIS